MPVVKLLPLFFLFTFVLFPRAHETLHFTLTHHNEIAHSHGRDGTVHYNGQDEQTSPKAHDSSGESHSLKESSVVIFNTGISSLTSLIKNNVLHLKTNFQHEMTSFELSLPKPYYHGPPDSVSLTCQVIVLSHPNKAPPVV